MRAPHFLSFVASLLIPLLASAPVSAADEFDLAVDQAVSNGVPGPGAGNIEVSGAVDVYTLVIARQSTVFFDETSGSCAIVWRCDGPLGVVFANDAICVTDPGLRELAPGSYLISVSANAGLTGTYGFVVRSVPPPQQFAIAVEQPVSNGVPAIGAGVIEVPGAKDIYTLTLTAGATVYFDEQGATSCGLQWRRDGPAGVVFGPGALCVTDPGSVALDAGTYTLTASGSTDVTGTYGFTVWQVNPSDIFTIDLKQTVSSGAPGPGAGNIEEPGATDAYILSIDRPTSVYFEEIAGGCGILWSCVGPSGVVFADNAICVTDPGPVVLAASGDYTITVRGSESTTGAYSFKTWELDSPQEFAIEVGDAISANVPSRGAGVLEAPGAIDVYLFDLDLPRTVYFDEIAGGCAIQWNCTGPAGEVFAPNPICVGDPGSLTLFDVGTYALTVFSPVGSTGNYAFTLVDVAPPEVFAIGLGEVVSPDAPGAGAGNIESPGSVDIYTLDVFAAIDVCFDEIAGPCGITWRAQAPNGATIFSNEATCGDGPGSFDLTERGTYLIVVSSPSGATGTYSFVVVEGSPYDLTENCAVGAADLAILLGAWGESGGLGSADFDADGDVDAADLGVLLGSWS